MTNRFVIKFKSREDIDMLASSLKELSIQADLYVNCFKKYIDALDCNTNDQYYISLIGGVHILSCTSLNEKDLRLFKEKIKSIEV